MPCRRVRALNSNITGGSRILGIIKRAAIWAVSGGLLAVVLWGLIAGTAWLAMHPMPTMSETVRDWPLSVLGTAFWALFIAAIGVPAYTLVFAAWLFLLRRRPELDATNRQRAVAAAGLSAPPVVMLTVGFSATSGFPFDWQEAAWVFPISALTCWGAIYFPQRILPILRRPLGAPAG
jgi:hypothetical protein